MSRIVGSRDGGRLASPSQSCLAVAVLVAAAAAAAVAIACSGAVAPSSAVVGAWRGIAGCGLRRFASPMVVVGREPRLRARARRRGAR